MHERLNYLTENKSSFCKVAHTHTWTCAANSSFVKGILLTMLNCFLLRNCIHVHTHTNTHTNTHTHTYRADIWHHDPSEARPAKEWEGRSEDQEHRLHHHHVRQPPALYGNLADHTHTQVWRHRCFQVSNRFVNWTVTEHVIHVHTCI